VICVPHGTARTTDKDFGSQVQQAVSWRMALGATVSYHLLAATCIPVDKPILPTRDPLNQVTCGFDHHHMQNRYRHSPCSVNVS